MKNIREIASVVRSKNAGPYQLTLDILFDREIDYRAVKERGMITPAQIRSLYSLTPDELVRIVYFDPALAVKIVLPRRTPAGNPGDTDVYGAQQHGPLLSLEFDL